MNLWLGEREQLNNKQMTDRLGPASTWQQADATGQWRQSHIYDAAEQINTAGYLTLPAKSDGLSPV